MTFFLIPTDGTSIWVCYLKTFIQVTQLNDVLRQKLKRQVERVAAAKVSENVLEIVLKILAA